MISSFAVPLIVLGIIVVIHELGHFLAARLFGIRVETFSIGFGPRIVGFRHGQTDYRISAIPVGGYLKMAGMNLGESATGAPDEFLSKPRWQRFIVAAAGPAMNVVLAVALLTGLFMYGVEVPEFSQGDAIVGQVETGSAADMAGILIGDHIVEIAGKDQPTWEDIEISVLTNAGQNLQVTLNRNGRIIETSLTPVRQGENQAGHAGIHPDVRVTNVIGIIQPGSPAVAAGLAKGDEIVAVDGIDVTPSGKSFSEALESVHHETVPLTILREGNRLDLRLTPVLQDGRRMIGVRFKVPMVIVKENFTGAVSRSIDRNLRDAMLVVDVLGKLVTGQTSVKSVDGPLGLMKAAGDFYEAGFGPLIVLMAMISLNLGLMNLLPIPILDGGLMTMLAIESLMGRDMSVTMKERVVQVGLVFLLTLMVFVVYNDVMKLLPS